MTGRDEPEHDGRPVLPVDSDGVTCLPPGRPVPPCPFPCSICRAKDRQPDTD